MHISTWNRHIYLSIYPFIQFDAVVSKFILVMESTQYYAQGQHQDQMLNNKSRDYLVGA